VGYVQDILDFTRSSNIFHVGLSPRAGLSLLQAAKAWAFIQGREYTLPEDIQKLLPFVVGHRLRRLDSQGVVPRDELMGLLLSVPVPS
jgi:MoxR-like ATPase